MSHPSAPSHRSPEQEPDMRRTALPAPHLLALATLLGPAAAAHLPRPAFAADDRAAGLFFEATQLPLVAQSLRLSVLDHEAEIALTQTFVNPTDQVAQADFRLPLPTGATVLEFGYWTEGRYMAAELAEREVAAARHARAADEGRQSGLARVAEGELSFSVQPVAPEAAQRVFVRLRLPVVTEAGRSTVAVPLRPFLGGGEVSTQLHGTLSTARPLREWGFEGGRPHLLVRDPTTRVFVARAEAHAELWWREDRPSLEVVARSVDLGEAGVGLAVQGFLSTELDDEVRPAVALVDASFSMRRKLSFVEAALDRLPGGSRLVAVAEGVQSVSSVRELSTGLSAGRFGHVLDPMILSAATTDAGCHDGARCVVITDGAGAEAALARVDVPQVLLVDGAERAHFGLSELPGLVRVDADPIAAVGRAIDGALRPALRLVAARVPGREGPQLIDLLGSRREAPAGALLDARGVAPRAPSRLEVELEVAGQPVRRTIPVVPAGAGSDRLRRSVFARILERELRRYAAEPSVERRHAIVALSLREGIPTPFTAMQVDAPKLSLRAIKGGDPHLTLPMVTAPGERAAQVVAVYPFGEVRSMVPDPARGEWVDRFLAPRGWDERWYRVDVARRGVDGRHGLSLQGYLLDDRGPRARLSLEKGALVVRPADGAAGVSMVRILRPDGRVLHLGTEGGRLRVARGDLPERFHLEVRDRAGNRTGYEVVLSGATLRVVGEAGPERSGSPPGLEHPPMWARGRGRFLAERRAGTVAVRVRPDRWLRFDADAAPLRSLAVEAVAEDGGRWRLGFSDGHVLCLACADGPRARCRVTTLRAADDHPVRGLARFEGRLYAAVLGRGLLVRQADGAWVRAPAGPRTRFVSALAVVGRRLYVGTLYDGLWRVARGRALRARFPVPHVDRLERSGGRLVVRTAFGRYARRGMDDFEATPGSNWPKGQDDLTSAARHRGRIVVGGFDRGLSEWSEEGLRPLLGAPEGDARAQHVNTICESDRGLYVGTESGLFLDAGGSSWVRVDPRPVHGLVAHGGGVVAATSDGVWWHRPEGATRLDPPNAGLRRAFTAVAVHRGAVYAGTLNGLVRLGPPERPAPEVLGPERGFRGGWVTALRVHRGALFVGTYAHGVWSLRRDRLAPVGGLEDAWVPLQGLASLGRDLLVGGLGAAPRILRPTGEVRAWAVPARDTNGGLLLEDGRVLLVTSDGPVVVDPSGERVGGEDRVVRR